MDKSRYNWLELASSPKLKPQMKSFLLKVGLDAERISSQLGIPVSGIVGQLALESGWGQSELSSKHNNLGGIKSTNSWTGNTVDLPTYEKDRSEKIVQSFRSYPSISDYMNDYASVISKDRYAQAKGTPDAYSFALALGQGGYHQDTPEEYAKSVSEIAKRLGLE